MKKKIVSKTYINYYYINRASKIILEILKGKVVTNFRIYNLNLYRF